MKGILGLLKRNAQLQAGQEQPDSMLFTTAFADYGVDPSLLTPWEARANEVGARRLPATRGMKLLQALWVKDRFMSRLDAQAIARLECYFEFASVAADRDVIRQDEYGNFMVVLLTGSMAVDRLQPWGESYRLTEARAGDILGEMSLLDSGKRFSLCTTLTESEIAVLSARALDDMMLADAPLAASLIALLARKLSMRLRVVSARLSEPPPRHEPLHEQDKPSFEPSRPLLFMPDQPAGPPQ